MKKKLIFLLILLLMLFGIVEITIVAASDNTIDDTTTIESDFKKLGLEIEDYYKPDKYDYEKFYCVAIGEKIEENIQTYFYFYNPKEVINSYECLSFYYKLNDKLAYCEGELLEYNSEHMLYKIKGFEYSYIEQAIIEVTDIDFNNEEKTYLSNFKAIVKHDNENYNIELSFNTMLILEEYDVIKVAIEQDGGSWNNLISCFTNSPEEMYVYFYNFNFPEYIEYDDVTYAKFEYDKVKYNYKDYAAIGYHDYENEIIEIDRKKIRDEYNKDSKTLRVNDRSVELTFPTLYLGNRIINGQFGDLDMNDHLEKFEYDCSVLLGSTYVYRKPKQCIYCLPLSGPCYQNYDYDEFEQIEILELHYEKDGVKYQSQVVSGIVTPGDPIEPNKPNKPNWLEELIAILKKWLGAAIGEFYEKNKTIFWIIGLGVGLIVFYYILKGIVAVATLVKNIINFRD